MRGNSIEGKRHVVTAPVQLLRSKNDLHCKHIDAAFCFETIKRLEELSSMLGPKEVCFLSQDDKARVPIGLTAATMQSPLLMHVEYRVTLPDHDWVVAGRHKLIPSVIAGIKIEENSLGMRDAVGYSDPTYIAIRSSLIVIQFLCLQMILKKWIKLYRLFQLKNILKPRGNVQTLVFSQSAWFFVTLLSTNSFT